MADTDITTEEEYTPKNEGDVTMELKKEIGIDEEAVEEVAEPVEEEPEPFKTFKTQDEFDEFVEEERQRLAELTKSEEEPKEEKPVPRFFAEDWKPKDWNDYTLSLLNNPTVKKYLVENTAGDIKAQIETMTAAERQELQNINSEFDKQYDDLAKKGLVPDRATDEGKAVDKQISTIGATYGQTSMTKAYELWRKIPVTEGGGLDYSAPNKAINAQKQKSALISGGTKGVKTEAPKAVKYDDVHKKSLDELVQGELDE